MDNLAPETLTALSQPAILSNVLINIIFTCLLSALMFYTFKKCRAEISYDAKFNITLVMIAIIVTLLMKAIQTNLALSVGMLGSLSIVRFRTNTKDPRDLGFVFWAMAIGLTSATENWMIGIIGSIVLAVFLIATGDNKTSSSAMLVVIRGNDANIPLITDTVFFHAANARLKAQNLLEDSFEVVYEIKTDRKTEQRLMQELMTLKGVDSVNMLAPSAEIS